MAFLLLLFLIYVVIFAVLVSIQYSLTGPAIESLKVWGHIVKSKAHYHHENIKHKNSNQPCIKLIY